MFSFIFRISLKTKLISLSAPGIDRIPHFLTNEWGMIYSLYFLLKRCMFVDYLWKSIKKNWIVVIWIIVWKRKLCRFDIINKFLLCKPFVIIVKIVLGLMRKTDFKNLMRKKKFKTYETSLWQSLRPVSAEFAIWKDIIVLVRKIE